MLFHWRRSRRTLAAGAAAGVRWRSVKRAASRRAVARGGRTASQMCFLRSGEGRSCSGLVRALGSARLWLRRLLSAARGS